MGLLDPELMKRKQEFQDKLQSKAESDNKLKEARSAWEKIAGAEKVRAEIIKPYSVLEGGAGFNCELFTIARTLVRAGRGTAQAQRRSVARIPRQQP